MKDEEDMIGGPGKRWNIVQGMYYETCQAFLRGAVVLLELPVQSTRRFWLS